LRVLQVPARRQVASISSKDVVMLVLPDFIVSDSPA
jgi:hypothetical protein